jgi:hypothetical protein
MLQLRMISVACVVLFPSHNCLHMSCAVSVQKPLGIDTPGST